MDDDAYARLADENAARLRAASDRPAELTAIFAAHDLVFGLYFDPESITRWDKFVMKGSIASGAASGAITCLWCRSIDEALMMADRYGDAS